MHRSLSSLLAVLLLLPALVWGQMSVSGPLSMADGDGTDCAPIGLGFAADTDTGFVRMGANRLGICTAGSVRWEFDASGNFVGATGLFVGLGSAAGRIVFTDAATDTIDILSANVGIGAAASATVPLILTRSVDNDYLALLTNSFSGANSYGLSLVTTGSTSDAATVLEATYNAVSGFAVYNSGRVRMGTGANGTGLNVKQASELHTLTAAATSDTGNLIGANSLVLGTSIRVTTEITGCATIDVGVAGATTRYGTGIALTAGTTNASPGTTNPTIYSAATPIRFTCVGGGASFTAGVIRTITHYIDLTAPTS